MARAKSTTRSKSPKAAEAPVEVAPPPPVDEALIARAHVTPVTRDGVTGLAASADAPALEAALGAALDRRDLRAATALAFGLASTGTPLSPALVARLLPDLDPRERVPALLRACHGDGLDVMRQALERGQLSHDREAVVGFLAARRLGAPPWPSPWPGLFRTLARYPLGTEAQILLGDAITRSNDPHLKDLGEEALEAAGEPHAGAVVTRWLEGWEKPLLEALPDTEPPRVVAGFTVRKAVERPGRNDVCHCGSGKKYKRCHGPIDDAAARSGEAPQLDFAKLSATDVDGMRIQEILGLPLERLPRPALLAAARQLRAYHRWEDAERALRVLAAMPAEGEEARELDELREDLIESALRLRAMDVVDRQLAEVRDTAALEARLRAALACARPSGETLAILDAQARRGLEGDTDAAADVAYSLLDHAPALGVLVARGVLDPAHPHYSELILEEVELARDRLELPPDDPFGPLYDAWTEQAKAATAREDALAAELTRMRHEHQAVAKESEERKAQAVVLEHELREAKERLERVVQREQASGPEAALREAQRAADERATRLSRKVDELKALLAEAHVERTALRERIASLEATAHEPAAPAPEEVAVPDGEPEEAEVADTTLPVRVPTFARKAVEALASLPAKVARAAVSITGRLGAGDRAAWRDVKRMQGMEQVWTARLGIHHRLIFTVTEDALSVLDVVTRENLLTSLERYR